MAQATLSEVIGQCLTDNEILALLTKQTELHYGDIEVALAHLDVCDSCQAKMTALSNKVAQIPRRPQKR